MWRRGAAGLLVTVACLTGCATSAGHRSTVGSDGKLQVVASINAWGSVLAQLGGDRVAETSIITSPDTDPHDYEPTPADARRISDSVVFVENGIGYDSWAAKAVAASSDSTRSVLDVGELTGVAKGGNPHRWYAPSDVETVAKAITAALTKADPTGAGYYADQLQSFDTTSLASYHALITDIRSRFAGTAVGASESIFAPLADALGLDLVTPASFLQAISEGTDPSAADKATIDRQIAQKMIKVYVYNSQNATPDVVAQVAAARKQGIAICSVTETLSPATVSFQDWQVAQLRSLQTALATATAT